MALPTDATPADAKTSAAGGRPPTDARSARAGLEARTLSAEVALPALIELARGAPTRDQRALAFDLLGDLAGRAYGAGWELAERAAWALIELARVVDSLDERRALCLAMGRGFRNVWLLPYLHRRLSDPEPTIVAAAATAAGGLGFPALEEAVAELLTAAAAPQPTGTVGSGSSVGSRTDPASSPATTDRTRGWDSNQSQALRLAAIAALGRMGSSNAAARLTPLLTGDAREAAAALTALTEIRSPVAQAEAIALLAADPEPEIVVAAVRYLAELGALEVLPALRRLARDADAERRTAASFASRALKAERSRDAGERFLIALSEGDRAVRAALARRLRTVPVAEVLEHAELLMTDDAEGVVQVLAELRAEEVSRYLLELVGRATLPDIVRGRAALAIEANQPWERDELAAIVAAADHPDGVRAAAAQAMGAFVGTDELFARIGELATAGSATLRGAFLWALQLAARPTRLDGALRKRTIDVVHQLLADPDRLVRRRAAYVAGNLGLTELTGELLASAAPGADPPADALGARRRGAGPDHPSWDADAGHRVAVFVAIGELRTLDSFAGTLELARKGEVVADADVQIAALRALSAIVVAHPGQPLDLGPLGGRLGHLLGDGNPLVREAAVRVAGLARGAVAPAALGKLAADPSPRVRAEVLTALGRLGAREAEGTLIAGFEDADPAIHERAALALIELGGRRGLDQVLAYVGGEGDAAARAHVAARLTIPPGEIGHVLPVVDATLERLGHDDLAYEPLLTAKVALLEAKSGAATTPAEVDQEIIGAFPSFGHMVKLEGFAALVKSLRTAEALYRSTTGLADADQSPPIVLWMKCLENYVHAWLGAKLNQVQREPVALFEYVDRITGAWPGYQRFIGERWRDQVELGTARVEVPARALVNVLREFQDHKRKRLDSPLSVTEWARLIVFFAVDHASGVKNLFKLPVKNPDQVIRLAHRLSTLAAVRNLVTHRAAASGPTLDAFRKSYYLSFEDLAQMA